MLDMTISKGWSAACSKCDNIFLYFLHCTLHLFHHPAAPHHYAVLGSPGLSSVPGLWPGTLCRASGAPRCQPAATLPAGHCHSGEGRKRCCQAHHAFTPLFLRHHCFHPHHQGNTEQEVVDQKNKSGELIGNLFDVYHCCQRCHLLRQQLEIWLILAQAKCILA